MVDVQGDFLRLPHGTTPAAVKSNKNQKWDPLRAMNKNLFRIWVLTNHLFLISQNIIADLKVFSKRAS